MSGRTDTEKAYLNFVGSYVDFADAKDQYQHSEGYIALHDGALEGIRLLNKLYNDGKLQEIAKKYNLEEQIPKIKTSE